MSALIPILPDRDRRRLVSVVGLLASDKDGEVVAAARAAYRLLQPHGVTVAQLVEAALPSSPWRDAPKPQPMRTDARRLALLRLSMTEYLNAWELAFCRDLARGYGPLSPRQAAKLRTIKQKIDEARQ